MKISTLRQDIPASLVVFLVSLPLSLGIALASGAPPAAGLVAAIFGGIVVGILGGAPLQVSGPAAGLSVMVYNLIQNYGFKTTLLITALAGITQAILGIAKMGELTLAISPAVIHAMLAAIGALIALGQIHIILGYSPEGSAIKNILSIPEHLASLHWQPLLVGVVSFLILLGWNRWIAKRVSWLPGALICVAVGTLISIPFGNEITRISITQELFSFQGMSLFDVSTSWGLVLTSALAVALVASAESLLCAVATDKLHRGARANLNRELFAQGIGNLASSFFGGLPVTGVIVRSSANVDAGAKTRISAILHGVWILIFASLFVTLLQQIPLAALAAVLVYIGIKLIKLDDIKTLNEFKEGLVYWSTFAGILIFNLLAGIGIGLGVALILLLIRLTRSKITVTPRGDISTASIIDVTLSGSLSFLSVPKLTRTLRQIPVGKEVHVSFALFHLDHAIVEAIQAWRLGYELQGGKVVKESIELLWEKTN